MDFFVFCSKRPVGGGNTYFGVQSSLNPTEIEEEEEDRYHQRGMFKTCVAFFYILM